MSNPILAAALLIAIALDGCATNGNPKDPLEPLNRRVYEFNQVVDRVALKPAAKGYKAAVPLPVRGGVNSFFGNFRDVTTAVNNLLQLKVTRAASDAGRVALNSTVGLFGVFDVATRVGLEKHDEDFGQTLGWWGVKSGPYLVLPLLGPSTIRDAVGLIGDYFTDPEFYLIQGSPESWFVLGLRVVNERANLLEADRLLEQAAIDRYSFLRDAYLQRRRSLIYDGNPPPERLDDSEGGKRKGLKELEEELGVDEPAPAGGSKPSNGSSEDSSADSAKKADQDSTLDEAPASESAPAKDGEQPQR
ncbi:MAG TPA: VacJ family lipoprotein [Burkholderiales bacterium]|nr:VacJ family lipoprotein [Burkholderiales bacterium]